MHEHDIIQCLKHHFPQHIGDDAAVLPRIDDAQKRWLITHDLLMEDVHFRLSYHEPMHLAHKALHVNLSDLAAMGATPHSVLLGLSLPVPYQHHVPMLLEAFADACKKANVLLIGGDTTRSPGPLLLSVTALGQAHPERLTYRHTAKAHQIIAVAGNLGHAHLGLCALESKQQHPDLDPFIEPFLMPKARMLEGAWLAQQAPVSAMMDTSDGLFIDLTRLTEASNLGAELNLDQFKPSDNFIIACRRLNLDPQQTQLVGGEDYGLLCTIDAKAYDELAEHFYKRFHYTLKAVGMTQAQSGIRCVSNQHVIALDLRPYSHF